MAKTFWGGTLNVVPYPRDLIEWTTTTGTNCSLSRDTSGQIPPSPAVGVSGSTGNPLQMYVTGPGSSTNTIGTLANNLYPARVGQTWRVTGWIRSNVPTKAKVSILEADDTGTVISTETNTDIPSHTLTGIIVATLQNSNNVLTSNDGGLTWTTKAFPDTPSSGNWTTRAICWVNGISAFGLIRHSGSISSYIGLTADLSSWGSLLLLDNTSNSAGTIVADGTFNSNQSKYYLASDQDIYYYNTQSSTSFEFRKLTTEVATYAGFTGNLRTSVIGTNSAGTKYLIVAGDVNTAAAKIPVFSYIWATELNNLDSSTMPQRGYFEKVSDGYKDATFRGSYFANGLVVVVGTHILVSTLSTNTEDITNAVSNIHFTAVNLDSSLSGIIWNSVTYNGVYWVACGTQGKIIFSPDGHNWYPLVYQSNGITNSLNSVVWTGTNFVIVGDGGICYISIDGINWAPKTTGTTSNILNMACATPITVGGINSSHVNWFRRLQNTVCLPYFGKYPDVAYNYELDNQGKTPEEFQTLHYTTYGATELRDAPTVPTTTSATFPVNGWWQKFRFKYTLTNTNTKYIQLKLYGSDNSGTGVYGNNGEYIWWDDVRLTSGEQVISIYNSQGPDGDDPVRKPWNWFEHIYFDSRFDYLNIVKITSTVTINYAAEAVNTSRRRKKRGSRGNVLRFGTVLHELDTHNLGYTPTVVLSDAVTGAGIGGTSFIQTVGNTTWRQVWLIADTSKLYLRERWYVRQNELPAFSQSYKIVYFNKAADATGGSVDAPPPPPPPPPPFVLELGELGQPTIRGVRFKISDPTKVKKLKIECKVGPASATKYDELTSSAVQIYGHDSGTGDSLPAANVIQRVDPPTGQTEIHSDELTYKWEEAKVGFRVSCETTDANEIVSDETTADGPPQDYLRVGGTKPEYTITPSSTSISEGGSVTFNITTKSVINGTSVNWANTGSENEVSSGSVTISGPAATAWPIGTPQGTASFSASVSADQTTEGDKTIVIVLTPPAPGTPVTADTVTVSDTSLTPPPPPPPPSGGGGGGCFAYGTQITLVDNSTINIEHIQVGQVLKTISIVGLGLEEDNWKTWSTTNFSYSNANATVTAVMFDSYSSYYNINNNLLTVTYEHPILTKAEDTIKFMQVRDIKAGISIFSIQGWIEVTSIEFINQPIQVVNLAVEDEDTYFANGILAHNNTEKN